MIEKLINLFNDQKIKSLIYETYYLGMANDPILTDVIFSKFYYLCIANNNINVIYNPKLKNSFFNPNTMNIYLNKLNAVTFLHELTHLLSYISKGNSFSTPQEFNKFKNAFRTNHENLYNVIYFLQICKSSTNITLESIKQKNLSNNENIESNTIFSQSLSIEDDIVTHCHDIIDALYDGNLHTVGLVYIKDNNHLPIKTSKTSGHGCEYYNKNPLQFEEIIANYLAIKILSPNNKLFIMLKNILGEPFISFFEEVCTKIVGMPDLTINKGIRTHKTL